MPKLKRFRVSGTLRIEFDAEVDAKDATEARDMVEGDPRTCTDNALWEEVEFDEVTELGDSEEEDDEE